MRKRKKNWSCSFCYRPAETALTNVPTGNKSLPAGNLGWPLCLRCRRKAFQLIWTYGKNHREPEIEGMTCVDFWGDDFLRVFRAALGEWN